MATTDKPIITLTLEELDTIHSIITKLSNEYEFTNFSIIKKQTGIGESLTLTIPLSTREINNYPIIQQLQVNLTNYEEW